tara:strand:- start:190 stop:393 length:204 start_codon:yes stop_codon:yes gene_type:complete
MRYAQSLNENIAMCDYVLSRLSHPIANYDTEYHGLVCEWLETMRDGWRSEIEELNNGTHWVQTGATQ